MPKNPPLIDSALELIELGYSVFPCRPGGKEPLTKNGFKDATRDKDTVLGWWKQCPSANIGLPTSELFVIDIDGFDNHWPNSPHREMELYDLAGAVSVTPSGGRHYIFKGDPGLKNTTGKIASRVDTRGPGGYIICPPSVVNGKPYQWLKNELDLPETLQSPPAWSVAALNNGRSDGPVVAAKPGQIPSGERNSTLASLAGSMRRRGMTGQEIFVALDAVNKGRCSPPLGARELAQIAGSVASYDPKETPVNVKFNMVDLDTVDVRDVDWLWHDRIPIGKITMVSGNPGLGKSYLTLDIASRCSTGRPFPDTPHMPNEESEVLIFNAEDDIQDTLKPRLLAAGANVGNIKALDILGDGDGIVYLDQSMIAMDQCMGDYPDARLVVIDPISSFISPEVDSHKSSEVRVVLTQMAKLAVKHHKALVVVSHLNKSTGGEAIHRTAGTMAYVAAARSVYGVIRDPENRLRRLFLPIKCNLAQDTSGLAYELASCGSSAHLSWDTEPITDGIDRLMRAKIEDDSDMPSEEAINFLRKLLTDHGCMLASDVLKVAKEEEISPRTLYRAKKELAITSKKVGNSWVWELKK